MPLAWAKVVAAHLIKQVKKYSSGYCGGGTHLLELPADGDPSFLDDQEIAKLEQTLAEVDDAIHLVLPGEGASEDTLSHRLVTLNEVIRNLRRAVIIKMPGGEGITFGGTPSRAHSL